MNLMHQISRALEPLYIKMKSMIVKAVVDAVNDSNEIQILKITGISDDVIENVQRVQEYGRTSVPPVGGQVIYAALNGNKDHVVALTTGYEQARPKDLESGDNVMWDIHGNTVELTEAGVRIISNTGGEITIADGKIVLNGNTPVARKGDTVSSDTVSDSTFWTWISAVNTGLNGLGVILESPTSLTSKITEGSSNVEAG